MTHPRTSDELREPRTHWGLIGLGLVVLTILLLLHGYSTGGLGRGRARESTEPATHSAAAVSTAKPIVELAGTLPRSVGMPDKTIALTFDDGPDPLWTPRILDALEDYDAKATFFPIGANIVGNPALTRRILAEGHEIGSHTYSHARWEPLPAWRQDLELDLFQKALAAATGHHTRLFRPPYAAGPNALEDQGYDAVRRAARAGYVLVFADRITQDWAGRSASQIVRSAMPPGGDGAVVLMHDAGVDRSATVAAVRTLLARLTAQGYRFTTVSEGLGMPNATALADRTERFAGDVLATAQHAANVVGSGIQVAVAVAGTLTLLRFQVLVWLARKHRRRNRQPPGPRPDAPFGPAVAVVVPAYNEAAGIAATVTSLVRASYPGEIDVVVVDDGSTDETAQIATTLGLPEVKVLRQPNAGKAAALKAGIASTRGEIVVMVDADTVFETTTLQKLVAPLADARVGAVSGNTKVGNRGRLLGRWQHLEYVAGFNLDRRMFDVLQCMPTVPGAIGAFRRAALDSVGGVCGDTLAEDTDLTMAMGRQGWRVVYVDSALAWTEAPASLGQLWRQRYRWCYGTLQAMWKHKRSWVSRGRAGRFGRRCLTYLGLFQVVLPLLAPAIDVFALYSWLAGEGAKVVAFWMGFTLVQALACGYALRLDGESLVALWTLPLQQFVYRQLIYLVTIQSVVTALVGSPLRWHAVERQGTFRAGAAVSAPDRHHT